MDGTVSYNGDRGIHTVQVSENVNVSTSLLMVKLFLAEWKQMTVRKSIFEIVEGLMGSIDPFVKLMKWAAQGKARVKLELPRQNQDWSFTLER